MQFRIDDIEKPWVFEAPFDLVHSRVCSGNAIRDWPKYLSEAYRTLRPGGWVEAQEFNLKVRTDDDSLPKDSFIQKWHDCFHEGMMLAGCNLSRSSQDIKGFMEDVGFINVTVIDLKLPISPVSPDRSHTSLAISLKRCWLRDILACLGSKTSCVLDMPYGPFPLVMQ